jgi:hypothetical protein
MAFMARPQRNSNRQKRRSGRSNAAGRSPVSAVTRPVSARPTTTRSAAQSPARSTTRSTSMRSNVRPIGRTKSKLRPINLGDQSLPSWLARLLKVNQQVWIGTIVLSLCTLGIYGWSVYSQQKWGQAYRNLEQLRRNERQLISNSEMMKNQIAERVDAKDLGLAPQVANDVIFLQPAPVQPNSAQPNSAQPANGDAAGKPPASSPPLGY